MTTPVLSPANTTTAPATDARGQAVSTIQTPASGSAAQASRGKAARPRQFDGLPKKSDAKLAAAANTVKSVNAFSASNAATEKPKAGPAKAADTAAVLVHDVSQMEHDAFIGEMWEAEFELITASGKRFNHDEFRYSEDPPPRPAPVRPPVPTHAIARPEDRSQDKR